MKDTRKLLSFRCDDSTYHILQKMSERNDVSLTMLLNQAMLMFCDAHEGLCDGDDLEDEFYEEEGQLFDDAELSNAEEL